MTHIDVKSINFFQRFIFDIGNRSREPMLFSQTINESKITNSRPLTSLDTHGRLRPCDE